MSAELSPPPVAGLSNEEKNWAVAAHLSSFLGWMGIPFANIVAPLVIYLIKREEMPYASEQAREVLNFQITVMIVLVISLLLTVVLVGFLGLIAAAVINLIYTIVGALKAAEGVSFRYPMTVRFVR